MTFIFDYLDKQLKKSQKENIVSFYHFQFLYIIINTIFHQQIYTETIKWVQSTEILFQYYPSFDLYLKHPSFYISTLICIQFIFLPLAIFLNSKLQSLLMRKDYRYYFVINLNAAKFIPFLIIIPFFPVYFFLITIIYSVLLQQYTGKNNEEIKFWSPAAIYQQTIHLVLLIVSFYLFMN